MGELSVWHLLIVLGIFMLLFGAKKLPEATRSAAQSIRIFKHEMETPQPPAATPDPPAIAIPRTDGSAD